MWCAARSAAEVKVLERRRMREEVVEMDEGEGEASVGSTPRTSTSSLDDEMAAESASLRTVAVEDAVASTPATTPDLLPEEEERQSAPKATATTTRISSLINPDAASTSHASISHPTQPPQPPQSPTSPSHPPPSPSPSTIEPLLPVATPLLPNHPIRRRITPETYPEIYTKIILQSRNPSVPINLATMVRALVQGWKEDGEWPPKDKAVEKGIARKKGQGKDGKDGGKGNEGGSLGLGGGVRSGVKAVGRVLRITGGDAGAKEKEREREKG